MAAAEKSANAIGAKTARACDSCLRRRARWYCAADDAFLCQSCDASVHSANQLARRHDRVRLDTASSKSGSGPTPNPKFADTTVPAWHHGFTRKARTPRSKKQLMDLKLDLLPPAVDLVPEISNEFDAVMDDSELEDHFFFRVPEFDPFSADDDVAAAAGDGAGDLDINELFLPTELDLAEFAADVESLLGKGDDVAVKVKGEVVEVEEEGGLGLLGFGVPAGDEAAGGVDWGGMESRLPLLEELDEKKDIVMEEEENCEVKKKNKKKMLLRLNYEDVMAAWAFQGCPWTTGVRPELGAGDAWPDCMGTCGSDTYQSPYGEAVGLIRAHGGDNKGREERVSRYREKRRTRMFSKKIRYQVRKLNAEKRPRMKGRFVKRSSASYPLINV